MVTQSFLAQILTVFCAFCTGLLAIWIQCGNTRKPRQVQGKQDVFITNIPIDEPSERSQTVRIKQPPGAYNPMYMKSPKSSTAKKKADAERSGKPNPKEKPDKQPSERTAIPGSELKSKLSTVSKKKETKKAASGVDKSGKNRAGAEARFGALASALGQNIGE
uniref:Secreted protein n=1 Tax=Bursaphelenchus xylophilus TaxID=6326 RepID=A0A1I7SK63_BURXY